MYKWYNEKNMPDPPMKKKTSSLAKHNPIPKKISAEGGIMNPVRQCHLMTWC